VLITIVAAIMFFGMGQYEARDGSRSNGLLWACLSLAMSWLVLSVLHGGVTLQVLGQVAVFVGIGIFRAMRDP
jgi:ATP/ADP translocase